MKEKYAAIIVGGGHAGAEAALAVARNGFPTLLLTMNLDSICQMSCNPAIGGLAKGHIVREIDALGGQMGLAIDATGIQFRMLNRSKGPAVWSPRAQADKKAYHLYMKQIVESTENIDLKQDTVEEILIDSEGKACGVRTMMGQEFFGKAVIITAGTFLKGLIHIGEIHYPSGRSGEFAAAKLSENLISLGFEVKRFKTGTPARLHARSIDFSKLKPQPGDNPPPCFSFRTKNFNVEQIPCFLAHTNEKTHEIIRKNLNRSAMYGGMIKGIGPRYCPSIEDKVVRFSGKTAHQIYLEPEGRNTAEFYANGLSTSLPQDVQIKIVRSIKGLENAEIMRLAYAIEYDYIPPTQLKHTLETKKIENLFFAGQVNGTTGYEEAAAQGLIAAFNVIKKLQGAPPFTLSRSEAYIGVLIDDLVTKGTNEPYRMFTSLAEFRLLLRQDNADERLMRYGNQMGLISDEDYQNYISNQKTIEKEIERLRDVKFRNETLEQILRKPGMRYKDLEKYYPIDKALPAEAVQKIENNAKYWGYLKRQEAEIKRFKKIENKKIPGHIIFSEINGLSKEAKEKFEKVKPTSFGQASRIPGITAGDLSLLAVYMLKPKTDIFSRLDYTEPNE
ncbi:MAG TPA: tRNA uridine-5-carboxymethylaminomethyl(34) synthesis enzyme MnmG [Candidatus Omnitrophota bacterium]|nr:tRNA uridine-5-carboxymethylaminomethyl(34) synthesis enzyme MnmG [Candidatus Omnitrophota bacterium]